MQTHPVFQQKSNVCKGSMWETFDAKYYWQCCSFPVTGDADLQAMQKHTEPKKKQSRTIQNLKNHTIPNEKQHQKNKEHNKQQYKT